MITLSKSKLLKFAELSELQIDGRSEFAYTNRLEHFAELVLSDLDVCMEHVPENGEPHQQLAAGQYERPCVLFRPKLTIDGDQWCALYGSNLQEGVAGFGKSPKEAMEDFDKSWNKVLK